MTSPWTMPLEPGTSHRTTRMQRDERERRNDIESAMFDGALERPSKLFEVLGRDPTERTTPMHDCGNAVPQVNDDGESVVADVSNRRMGRGIGHRCARYLEKRTMTHSSGATPSNPRFDPSTGALVHVVGSRQNRPNLPSAECPFCVGGLEAPEPYSTRWFANRWPSMPDDRCEVILYSDDHSARFVTLGVDHLRSIIDLWAERSTVHYDRSDTSSVLIFENSGRDVGATIDHPHGQLYSFDHVPQRTARRIESGWKPSTDRSLLVGEHAGFVTCVSGASPFPVALEIAPLDRVGRLADLTDDARHALAHSMRDALERLTTYFGETPPYMLWVNQRPNGSSDAWLNVEIVSPWRAPGVMRYIAAAEVSTGEYFNPLVPEQLAQALRERLASPR